MDVNNSQTFRVQYTLSGNPSSTDFTYTKIKSFLTSVSESTPQPTPTSITANRCQSQNFNISFNNVQFANPWVNPKQVYGTNTSYEYLLPNQWVLNSTTSTGSNWIAGTNNVTVTSDLSNGDGGVIRIRTVNSCAANLVPGPEAYVSISRPAPTLTITGSQDYLCSGNTTFTVNGMPSGSSVQWSVSNSNELSIVSGGTSSTVTVSRIGSSNTVVTLTATVTHCTFTYPVTHDISLGVPKPNPIEVILVDPAIGRIQVLTDPPLPGASSYNWYKNGVLHTTHHGVFAQIPITRDLCDVWYDISVEAINACGTSAKTHEDVYVEPCGYRFMATPNPANSSVTISIINNKTQGIKNQAIDEVRIYDLQGNLKKYQKYAKVTTGIITVTELKEGTYFIEIISGLYKERKQLLIQR